jgi:hypothetical protein
MQEIENFEQLTKQKLNLLAQAKIAVFQQFMRG